MKRPINLPGIFVFCLFITSLGMVSCSNEVDEKEFLAKFKALSDKRISFRINMKALGDSSRRHREYAKTILDEVEADTLYERLFKADYIAYNDSLRNDLRNGKTYFENQYIKNKPLVGRWEKTEMELDGMVERIKSGDLSEREGLDSMEIQHQKLSHLIVMSDSLVKVSTKEYWKFRKTLDEYRYNMKNLKILYAKDLPKVLGGGR
jgi:hypothetical protein